MDNEKRVLIGASVYKEKYFVNPDFKKIPKEVIEEMRILCVRLSAKLHCICTTGFYSDGKVYIQCIADENDYQYDEIGAKLEIDKAIKDNKDLINSLELWYKVFVLKKN